MTGKTAKVEFKSGAWAEIRTADSLTARDKTAYSQATSVPLTMNETGQNRIAMFNMGQITRQTYAVLAQLITAWSYDWILPSEDLSCDDEERLTYAASIENLPLDDYNELEEAIQPHLAKLGAGPKASVVTTTGSRRSSKAATSRTRKA